MTTSNKSNTNDVVDLDKLSLTTGLHIAQMARYETQFVMEKESHSITRTSVSESNENRDKMIKYACLAGIGILGLFAIGIAGLKESNRKGEAYDFDWE